MKENRKRGGIILQVAILFALAVLTTGILTFITQHARADASVKVQAENHSEEIADEVTLAVREFPAFRWLINYWYNNYNILDIDYDSEFVEGTKTEKKYQLFTSRNPDISIKYVGEREIATFSGDDKALYAEICYSWLITRINQIKQTYKLDYLFCVITEEPYTDQFFLFSGADPGAVRGTEYEQVYPLGHQVKVDESLQEAMRSASQFSSHLADAGNYVDYYSYLCHLDDGKVALIGMTYNLAGIRGEVSVQTWRGTAFAVSQLLVLFVLCMALISRFVLSPLRNVQKNIRLYKNTKDSGPVIEQLKKVKPYNEIGELSEDIIELTTALDQHMAELQTITAERERITTELALATRLQGTFVPNTFPPFPDRTEFDIYALMEPAREVGGDFYDYFLIDEDHLCLVMADVSGKGIPAALFMMFSKFILQSNAMRGDSPAKIMESANREICRNNQEDMFVTVWLGILEISTGKLVSANAGHEHPIVSYPGEGYRILKSKHGFVVGGYEMVKYREEEITLKPGSRLFLYTDGLPEASDKQLRMFGMENIEGYLNRAGDLSPEQIIRGMRKAVDDFTTDGEQFDDLTMLCLEYRGK